MSLSFLSSKRMDTLFDQAATYLPLIGTSFGVFIVLFVANWALLGRYPEFGNERKLPRQLVMLGLTVTGAVAVAIVLPVSDSTRNQIIALIGVLLSGVVAFSSTTVISNLMAGLMLRMSNSFRAGDFIHVEEYFGRVAERGLFNTEIQTERRNLVYLSNSYLVSHPITVVRTSGTIIAATLSLGYDVHHSRVQSLLIAAAQKTGLEDPFVQIVELGNYAITYRISGLLTEIKSMLTAQSNLHRTILDTLHEEGIEIVSPTFMNQRRVADDAKILPAPLHAVPPLDASEHEEIVFDKAEKVERREKAKVDLQEQIGKLEKKLESVKGETKQNIETSIEQKRERLAVLEKKEETDHGSHPSPIKKGTAAKAMHTRK